MNNAIYGFNELNSYGEIFKNVALFSENNGNISFDGNKVKLFSTEIYKKNHLTKPDVLDLIDYLNKTMGYKLDYNTFTSDELLDKVVKLHE